MLEIFYLHRSFEHFYLCNTVIKLVSQLCEAIASIIVSIFACLNKGRNLGHKLFVLLALVFGSDEIEFSYIGSVLYDSCELGLIIWCSARVDIDMHTVFAEQFVNLVGIFSTTIVRLEAFRMR